MNKWANRIALVLSAVVVVGLVGYWELYGPKGEADPFQNGWLTYPNGGTELQTKDGVANIDTMRSDLMVSGVVTIQWDKDRVKTDTVNLFWSTNERKEGWPAGEGCWMVLYTEIAKNVPNTGSYNWDTTAVTNAKPELNGLDTWSIKIMDSEGMFYDSNNAYFAVNN
jgi:hypothetical protein